MDRDLGQDGVKRLLKTFDQQGPIAIGRHHVGVEVRALHTLGVRQQDTAHSDSRELRPEAPQHLRPRHGKQEVDPRVGLGYGLEDALQKDRTFDHGKDGSDAPRPAQDTDPDGLSRHNSKHVGEMRGARPGEAQLAAARDLTRFKKNQIHGKGKQPGPGLRKSIRGYCFNMQNTTTTPSDTVTAVSWVSYMLHFVVAVAAVIPGIHASVLLLIVAFIADMVMQGDASGSFQESHYTWRLKTVVWASVAYLVTSPLFLLLYIPGWIAWCLISLWFLYRIVKGLVALTGHRAV